MPLPSERLRGIDIFAKSPRPSERAKSSAWATCLEVSRATAIKPDAAYVAQTHEIVKFLIEIYDSECNADAQQDDAAKNHVSRQIAG